MAVSPVHLKDFWVYGLPELKVRTFSRRASFTPPLASECLLDTFSIYIYLQRALPLKCHYRCRVHSLIATSKMERWMGVGG